MQSAHQITVFIVITTAIIFLLAVVVVTLLYFYQKRQLAYNKNLNSLKLDFEKNLLKTQIEIQEQTFQDISREIHDNINLSLTLAKLNLVTADLNNNERMRTTIKSSSDILGSAITELNNLSKSINAELIREIGLMKALKIEMDKLVSMAGLQVSCEIKGEPIFLKGEKELVIFRIIQEAFNNIIKHSKATSIQVELNYSTHFLEVTIKDNGIGFYRDISSQEDTHSGLNNMKTRAEILGGNFFLETRADRGTQILVSIPYYS